MKPLMQSLDLVPLPAWAFDALKLLNAMAHDSGVRLFAASPRELVDNVQRMPDAGGLLGEHADYRVNPAVEGSMMTLLGFADDDCCVTTNTVRRYDGDLVDLLETLRLWFDDKARAERSGMSCIVEVPGARQIGGTLVHSGTAWVHPTFRGHRQPHFNRLSQINGRISRILAVAYSRRPDYLFSTVPTDMARKGVVANMGWPRSAPGLVMRAGEGMPVTLGNLQWASAEEVIADARHVTATSRLETPSYPGSDQW